MKRKSVHALKAVDMRAADLQQIRAANSSSRRFGDSG